MPDLRVADHQVLRRTTGAAVPAIFPPIMTTLNRAVVVEAVAEGMATMVTIVAVTVITPITVTKTARVNSL